MVFLLLTFTCIPTQCYSSLRRYTLSGLDYNINEIINHIYFGPGRPLNQLQLFQILNLSKICYYYALQLTGDHFMELQ